MANASATIIGHQGTGMGTGNLQVTFHATMTRIVVSSLGVVAYEGAATLGGEKGSSQTNKEGSSFETALNLPTNDVYNWGWGPASTPPLVHKKSHDIWSQKK